MRVEKEETSGAKELNGLIGDAGGAGAQLGVADHRTSKTEVVPAPGKSRFYGTAELKASTYVTELKKIHDEVLVHLNRAPGTSVRLTLEVEAIALDGFDDDTVRTVAENAQTLKFRQSGFESD